MAHQRLDIAQALGRIARRIARRRLHRGLDRDLDVLDPPLLVVFGPLGLLSDRERALLAVCGPVEDRLGAIALGDALALAERDARAVDVLADDGERRRGGGHAAVPAGPKCDGIGLNWQPSTKRSKKSGVVSSSICSMAWTSRSSARRRVPDSRIARAPLRRRVAGLDDALLRHRRQQADGHGVADVHVVGEAAREIEPSRSLAGSTPSARMTINWPQ